MKKKDDNPGSAPAPQPKGNPGSAPAPQSKDNPRKPLKMFLREHSVKYFAPNPFNDDCESDFDKDLRAMAPADRADLEVKILRFHTPQMHATSVDLSLGQETDNLVKKLARLADENE